MDDANCGMSFIEGGGEGGGFHAAAAAIADPLIGTIVRFRRELAIFNARAHELDDDERVALEERTWRQPYLAITAWQRPAVTREGAIEALKLADDAARDGDYDLVGPMLKASRAFFEKDFSEA